MTRKRATIGIAVPAWRATAFIAETLRSALDQKDVDIRIQVGVDGGDAATADRCDAFQDSRIAVRIRPERLGWVGNSNATLYEAARSGVDYATILPHDDVIAPDYCARLVAEIEKHPGTAVAYSDILGFGESTIRMEQPSALGSRIERLEWLLRHQMIAIAYRGIMPAEIALQSLPIPANAADDYAADTAWMVRQIAQGEFRRVPEALYLKRYHADNTHSRWQTWNRGKRFEAFLVHCRACFEEAMAFAETADDRGRIVQASMARLDHMRPLFGALGHAEQMQRAELENMMLDAL